MARLMRDMGLAGVIRGKTVRTTVSDKAAPCPLDRVNRQFRAPAPNMLWVSDFTYASTWSGFVYVAFVVEPRGSPDIDGIIAAVSDPARFKNAAAFAAYVGVVPGLKQSGKNGSRRAACIHGQCSPVQGAVYAGRGRTPAQCLAQAVL